jgi:1,4-dihydroxy-2-naphthoyl-CoA hydrolase
MIEAMPFAAGMGIRLIESTPQRVVAEMLVRDDLCTTNSILHGGAIMAFADSLGAVAAMLNLPEGAGTTTLESKTNFVGAVRAGDTARASCEPIHIGRATTVWQTRITRGDGKLAAVVTQTQMTLTPR